MLRLIYRSAVAWTAVGLVGGLAYREVTKLLEFTRRTQLAVVHTHALVLLAVARSEGSLEGSDPLANSDRTVETR